MTKADLHTHTNRSDGRISPGDLVQYAFDKGLGIIAVTDHDTIDGYREAKEAAKKVDIEVLAGVELTTDFKGRETHLLAYCFDHDHPDLSRLIDRHKKARVERAKWIVEKLLNQGLDVNINEVRAEANGSNLGRPHIASVLVDKGYVAGRQEAFVRYLSDQQLGTIQSEYSSLEESIDAVKKAGGVTALAHPGRSFNDRELQMMLDAGIDGIEVIHPSHDYRLQKKFEKFVEQHNLLMTGGSDYHGSGREYEKYLGILTISENSVDKIKRLAEQRKKLSEN
ncbi:MAG: PHP domain-containing protein [Balneolaceae bacterium]|nr:PHP domain-containing protein [Balneolaceae bacterium]